MHRFILIFGIALLWLDSPIAAKDKPKPPAISGCVGKICVTNLKWKRPDWLLEATDQPNIEGVLVNQSASTLTVLAVEFTLKSNSVLVGTAPAFFSGEIPPGGRWVFKAAFPRIIAGVRVTKIESFTLRCFATQKGSTVRIDRAVAIDPLFDPSDRSAIKNWEKIHGKRQR